MNVRCSPGGNASSMGVSSAGRQVFAVDPQRRALGLGRHLKHRHLAPKRIAPTGRVLTVAGWQLLDSQVLAEVVERLVVAPELAKHDRRVEKRIAAPHDAKAVDVRFERALKKRRSLRAARTARLLVQPIPLLEVDARLRVLRRALGSRNRRARQAEKGDEHDRETSRHYLEVCLNRRWLGTGFLLEPHHEGVVLARDEAMLLRAVALKRKPYRRLHAPLELQRDGCATQFVAV